MKIAIIQAVTGLSGDVIAEDEAYIKGHLRESTEITTELLSTGFSSVETAAQTVINGAKIIEKVLEIQNKGYDGIFINCFDDPGVLGAREVSNIPVIGPYAATMHYALTISEKVAVISTDEYGIVCEKRKAREHGLENHIAAFENVGLGVLELDDEVVAERIKTFCLEMEKLGVHAVIMGCTGMDTVADKVRQNLKDSGCTVQVLEPFKVGMKMLEMIIEMKDFNLIKSTSIDFDQYIR
ncbi:MAG: aspartate/glutamate racemase family protein [Firmicutes bacterium]|nr:aspartate/glutamate racemase family protein [Bacillota bacterium]